MRFKEFLLEEDRPFKPRHEYYAVEQLAMSGVKSHNYEDWHEWRPFDVKEILVAPEQRFKFHEYKGDFAVFKVVGTFFWFVAKEDWTKLVDQDGFNRMFMDSLKESWVPRKDASFTLSNGDVINVKVYIVTNMERDNDNEVFFEFTRADGHHYGPFWKEPVAWVDIGQAKSEDVSQADIDEMTQIVIQIFHGMNPQTAEDGLRLFISDALEKWRHKFFFDSLKDE